MTQLVNPNTGETWMAPSTGWTVNTQTASTSTGNDLGTAEGLTDTLADRVSGVMPAGTSVAPVQLEDSQVTGTEQTYTALGTDPTMTATTAAAAPTVTAATAPSAGSYDVTATTVSGNVPTAQAAQLTDAEMAPEIKIDEADVGGTLSSGATAVAAQGQVQQEQLVSYQLGELYKSIQAGQPLPAWAAGPTRAATQIMTARGLGTSSMAAAAVAQSLIEAGVPIAAADAAEYSKLNVQNLTNRQQAVLQNAATVAQMDMANADARTKAAIQNAQSFLSIDLQNLSNEQATSTLNYQGKLQALMTDAAAENAAAQFNAKNQVQVDQFFAELGVQVDNANANRVAAMSQFNVDQVNSAAQFNASMRDARDRFDATMQVQIDQSNAQWRRDIATADTAAINEAQRQNALNTLEVSQSALSAMWQRYRDESAWLMQSTENAQARAHQMAMLEFETDATTDLYELQAEYETAASVGNAAMAGVLGYLSSGE
jgi:hypothetical protein